MTPFYNIKSVSLSSESASFYTRVRTRLSLLRYIIFTWFSNSLIGRPISNAWYWLRTHTYNRYHIVDCRSPQNDYKWGWMDRNHLMWYACFNILKDFVEKEMYGFVNWEHEDIAPITKEIMELYTWWIIGRAKEHIEHHKQGESFDIDFTDDGMKVTNEEAWDIWRKRDDELNDKDKEMLERLMKVRKYLWT